MAIAYRCLKLSLNMFYSAAKPGRPQAFFNLSGVLHAGDVGGPEMDDGCPMVVTC